MDSKASGQIWFSSRNSGRLVLGAVSCFDSGLVGQRTFRNDLWKRLLKVIDRDDLHGTLFYQSKEKPHVLRSAGQNKRPRWLPNQKICHSLTKAPTILHCALLVVYQPSGKYLFFFGTTGFLMAERICQNPLEFLFRLCRQRIVSVRVRAKKKQRKSDRSHTQPHSDFCSPDRDCKCFLTDSFTRRNRSG